MSTSQQDETGPRPRTHRTITDAPSLQALTHPTRLALIEAIAMAGTMTATQASRVVGESPTACAYHLRTLARVGFIEEAGGGHGRERPWRLAQTGLSSGGATDDPAYAKAAEALEKTVTERLIGRIRRFQVEKTRYPEDIRDVTGVLQSVLFVTPDELRDIRGELLAVLTRYVDRIDPERRPAGSYPFEVAAFTHVFDVPGPGSPGAERPGSPHP